MTFYPEYCVWKCQNCQVGQSEWFLVQLYITDKQSENWPPAVWKRIDFMFYSVHVKVGQSYLGFTSHQPSLSFLCISLPVQALLTVLYPPVLLPGLLGRACSRNLVLCCCFYTLFPASKKKKTPKYVVSVFKNRRWKTRGLLTCCRFS